ncbi:hypothetical protein OMR71_03235, partial [Escherichia coli]|nr:hypothetical protein [Escherichia coli]MCW4507964.1 hypothetical protein [Escherichia coli]
RFRGPVYSEKRVSSEANKEKSDITELLRKQVRPD